MTAVRPATETVAFVDDYCAAYRDLFGDVRSFSRASISGSSVTWPARHCPRWRV